MRVFLDSGSCDRRQRLAGCGRRGIRLDDYRPSRILDSRQKTAKEISWPAYFYEFLVRNRTQRILTKEYLPCCFSPFCYGGDDEIFNQTACQSGISRSKNALAPETEGGANNRRSYWPDRRLLGAGILFSGSPQSDRKSFADAHSPLRIPGVGRATGSLSVSHSISILKCSEYVAVRHVLPEFHLYSNI